MNDQKVECALKDLSIDEQDMLSTLAPYISASVPQESPSGRFLIRQRFKNLVHMIALLYWKQFKQSAREKTGKVIQNHYEDNYGLAQFSGYAVQGRPVTYLYGENVIKMVGMGNSRAKVHVVEKVLNIIQPATACEIGSGTGRHVIYFAHKFPKTQFSGIDFSENAVSIAKSAQQQDDLDLQLPEAPGNLSKQELNSVLTAKFHAGNACDLSEIEDNAFEVIYTTSALEQMWGILPDVLSELHRVTRKYVIFCEPFLEGNNLLGRQYLFCGNYFRAKISQMEDAGFEVLNHLDCLPIKPTFKDTVLIAKVIKTPAPKK